MPPLPATYPFLESEKRWNRLWEEEKLFSYRPSERKCFCLVIPPPNITGSLHMGHALVNILQDLVVRWQRMCGEDVLWVPGVDHAGIATQTAVEKHLTQSEGKSRTHYGRELFLEKIWKWKREKEEKIIEQLRGIGCSCDWSRHRFTLDEGCSKAVKRVFKKLFDQGLLYRGNYLVNWDPITQSALSDEEVEYEERESFLWYFRYPYADGSGSILIATTRPETLLADSAVAVHPQDASYRGLIGKQISLPLTGRTIPLIADEMVDSQFGTGAVKITPAHDHNDYEVGKRHRLPFYNLLRPDGTLNELAGRWEGFSTEEARAQIVQEMCKLGLLERVVPHKHRIGLSYRSKAIIEPFLSKQWFVRMAPFKARLREIIERGEVELLPSHWKNTYFHWIDQLRDWCISRQLWWGHRIPVWYHRDFEDRILCQGDDRVPHEVEEKPEEWICETDVLDTWFSSALWPFSALNWPEENVLFTNGYPNALLITGHDILFFWVARMILMGEYVCGQVPFPKVLLTGLIYGKSYWRNEPGGISYITGQEQAAYDLGEKPLPKEVHFKWEKMSKSVGNVIDPLEMARKYGVDALRMALCSSSMQASQIDLDRRIFSSFQHFTNKIWNAARFILSHLDQESSREVFLHPLVKEELAVEDRWILNRFYQLLEKVSCFLENYAFDQAIQEMYDFFWKKFCSYYLEMCKPVLFGKRGKIRERREKQKLLLILLDHFLRLLHPVAPFLTEELFEQLKSRYGSIEEIDSSRIDSYTEATWRALQAKACAVAPYPKPMEKNAWGAREEKLFSQLLAIVYQVRKLRGEMQLPLAERVALSISLSSGEGEGRELLLFLQNHDYLLYSLLRLSTLSFQEEEEEQSREKFGARGSVGGLSLFVPLPDTFQEREKKRLKKEREEGERAWKLLCQQLENEQFVARAPVAVVREKERQRDEWKEKIDLLTRALGELSL